MVHLFESVRQSVCYTRATGPGFYQFRVVEFTPLNSLPPYQAQQRKKTQEDEAYKARIYEMKRVLRDYRHKSFTAATSPEERAMDADPIVDLKIKEKNANENIWSTGKRDEG